MADVVSYASFMIRMWRDPAAEPDEADGEEAVWAGEIESVQSGRVVPFKGVEALVEILVRRLTELDIAEGGRGSDPSLPSG